MTGRTKRLIRREAPTAVMFSALLFFAGLFTYQFIVQMDEATANWIAAREAVTR